MINCQEAPPQLLSSRLAECFCEESQESKHQKRAGAQTRVGVSETALRAGVLPSGTVSTREAPSGSMWSQGSIDTFERFGSIHKPWVSVFWLSPPDGWAKSLSSGGSHTGCVNILSVPDSSAPLYWTELRSWVLCLSKDSKRVAEKQLLAERGLGGREGGKGGKHWWLLGTYPVPDTQEHAHIWFNVFLTDSFSSRWRDLSQVLGASMLLNWDLDPESSDLKICALKKLEGHSEFFIEAPPVEFLVPDVYTLLDHSFIHPINFPEQALGAR